MSERQQELIKQFEFSACDTFPKHFMRECLSHKGSKEVSMSFKDWGIWKSYTWDDCYKKVKLLSLGLAHLGFQRGKNAVILGENKPEWYWGQLAVQALGGAVVGVFTDCIPDEVKYYVEDSESVLVIAHDQEQVDKIIEIIDDVSALKHVVYWEGKGLWNYSYDFLLSFEEVTELGREFEKGKPNFFEDSIAVGQTDDDAVICYTSGTTGQPKGVILSQKMLLKMGGGLGDLDNWKECSRYLSFIPPAWATEQFLGFGGWLIHGIMIAFPEKPETVQNNIREIGPDLMFYGARLWENVSRSVQAKIADTSRFRRLIYERGMSTAMKMAESKMKNNSPGIIFRLWYRIIFMVLLRQLRDRLGLSNTKVVYSAGGALSPEIVKYFLALGVEIKLFYGATETGAVSVPRKGDIRPETSGTITPWNEVKLSEEGEILIKGDALFTGYYNRPEATREKFKEEWFLSGDFGYLTDDGHLVVIDRMQDLKPLGSQGKKFSPQYIEARLRFSPFIKDVMVVSSNKVEEVGALINIDLDNTGRFAESNGIPYTTFTDLSQRQEIVGLIRKEIQGINETLPQESRVKRFLNFPKELDPDEAELTRTRKLRRDHVEGIYSNMVDALFGEKGKYSIEMKVSYRDGKKGIIKTDVYVNIID